MDTVEEIVNNTTTDYREVEIDNEKDESDYYYNNNGDFNEVETYDYDSYNDYRHSKGDYGSYNRDYYNYDDDETHNYDYNDDETYNYSDYGDDEYNYSWFEEDRFYDAKESFIDDDDDDEGYDSDDSEYRYWYDDAKDAFDDSDEWSDGGGGGGGWTEDEWGVGFKKTYLVYPLSHIGRTNLQIGNKIILPLSALTQLMDIGADFPMLFKVENTDNCEKTSHCGVLEFTSEEGEAILPEWMMKNLSLEEGGSIRLQNVTLEAATYVKLQPHSMEFLDIRNPKAVLETAFCLGYSCLTVGDTVVVMHEGKKLYIDIVDAKPSNAVCVLETDVEVDFALPLDYKVPVKPVPEIEEPSEFVPFSGRARRLSDPKGGDSNEESVSSAFSDDGSKNDVESSKSKTKIVFGGGGSSKSTAGSNASENPSDEKTFEAFTGNKYRLIDS